MNSGGLKKQLIHILQKCVHYGKKAHIKQRIKQLRPKIMLGVHDGYIAVANKSGHNRRRCFYHALIVLLPPDQIAPKIQIVTCLERSF